MPIASGTLGDNTKVDASYKILKQARRHVGAFRAVSPQITACAFPSEKCAFRARIVPRKKVAGPVPLECILGPVPPKNTACAPKE